jgi:hypothetical protein
LNDAIIEVRENMVYGIFCHDAGAANIICQYIHRKNIKFLFCCKGPAEDIFLNSFGDIYARDFDAALCAADLILTGTSWRGNLELNAIKAARAAGKRVVSVLDHWIEYPRRFLREGVSTYPDEFWVCDTQSLEIARGCLPPLPIQVIGNPLIDSALDNLMELRGGQVDAKAGRSFLYISDNIYDFAEAVYGDPMFWGYSDLDAVRFCLDYFAGINFDYGEFIIRPHPSQNPRVFMEIPEVVEGLISISENKNLMSDLERCSTVLGGVSMALAIAESCQKNIVIVDPPLGKAPKVYGEKNLKWLTQVSAAILRVCGDDILEQFAR